MNNQPFLLHINGGLEALEKADCRRGFGVNNTMVKVCCSTKPHDEVDLVDIANEQLEKKIDGPTGSDDRLTQVDHADKFAAFEVRLS